MGVWARTCHSAIVRRCERGGREQFLDGEMDRHTASLSEVGVLGTRFLTDIALVTHAGVVVAFSSRLGGTSRQPYTSLNLAAHVGDDPDAVDANRDVFLRALKLEGMRSMLTTAEQVHGSHIVVVGEQEAGFGAQASGLGRPPLPSTDAVVTTRPQVPLMLLFADCVPVILVAPGPPPGIAVVHAGWKGALDRLPAAAAVRLAEELHRPTSETIAYVGPHIGPCHYQVDEERLSRFEEAFGSMAAARGGLDLGAVVTESLSEVGVPTGNVVRTGICTAERTDSFYSFRAEGHTGRHAALAVILGKA